MSTIDKIKNFFFTSSPKQASFEERKAVVDSRLASIKRGEVVVPAVTSKPEEISIPPLVFISLQKKSAKSNPELPAPMSDAMAKALDTVLSVTEDKTSTPVKIYPAGYVALKNEPVPKGQEVIKVIPEVTVKPLTEHDVVEAEVEKSVVAFHNVTKKFGNKVALDNINFVVRDPDRKGRLIAIVGQSGCGKSTLLRMIAGLRPHAPSTSGVILVDGKPLGPPSSERGLVDQKYSLFPHLTVVQNIAFGLKIQGMKKKEAMDRAREWVKKVQLEGSEDKYPSELSGGMQQRVSIAATLILSPKILLMDEPFGALDPKIRLRMQELLVELWREQKATVFLVTHSIEEAIYVGDRVFRMGSNPGRLIEQLNVPRPDEPPEVFRTRPWFNEIVTDLRMRLEQDAPAKGELPNGKHEPVKA